MLAQEKKLIDRKDFDLIYRSGKGFSEGSIFLKIKEKEIGKTRVGFSVGLKFSKKAVERNKLKRQLRGMARKYLAKTKKSADIIVMVKKKTKEKLEKISLENDFKKALQKAKIIN